MTRRWFGVLAAALVLIPLTLSAQRTAKRVFVSAVDAAGAPVLTLTRADLEVTENGSPREITRVALGTAPLRVVLLVDSSTSMGPMVNSFRAGLHAFADTLPARHEITFVTTGGQIRVRTQPATDRAKLKLEIGRLASDGGANAFLDTLIESDRRFLKTAPGQWPVVVIVTTDRGETQREFRLDDYNRFMNDFVARGGSAHAVIVRGKQIGPVTDLTLNLIDNVGGLASSINTDNVMPELMTAIAERLAADHQKMAGKYEVDFTGDAKLLQPIVNVVVKREDVQLQMSPRRPF
ncbi:MAG: VWA domain-containing protein [Vicinamibacterales bacterium]|jgi:hypothetical protein